MIAWESTTGDGLWCKHLKFVVPITEDSFTIVRWGSLEHYSEATNFTLYGEQSADWGPRKREH